MVEYSEEACPRCGVRAIQIIEGKKTNCLVCNMEKELSCLRRLATERTWRLNRLTDELRKLRKSIRAGAPPEMEALIGAQQQDMTRI